jgi:hypothetical protein
LTLYWEEEMEASAILQPVVALGLWTAVMMVWMYATRIPAIGTTEIPDDKMGHPAGMQLLPSEVRRIADNYNHLFEQPTLFYAIALTIAVAGHVDTWAVNLAWAFCRHSHCPLAFAGNGEHCDAAFCHFHGELAGADCDDGARGAGYFLSQ